MMNTILLAFVIVITLMNLALALSTFGYITEINKKINEWFETLKTLTEACSGLCEENGHVITSLMKHIEYTEKGFNVKEKEIQELNDRYDKLYEEFKKLEETVDECRDYRFEKYLKGLDPDYLLELQSEENNDITNELDMWNKIREMSMNKIENNSDVSLKPDNEDDIGG